MSENRDNGGPAFPCDEMLDQSGTVHRSEGMSLRDYFAAKAMQGICCNRSHVELKGHANASAKVAYVIADALLEARK